MASRNLTLGRGKLYFGEFLAGTQTPGGLRFIGNVTELNISSDAQELTHRSSTEGRNKKDYSAVLETERALAITTDDLGHDNVGLFAMGAVETVAVSSGTAVESTFAEVQQGLTYQLGVTTSRPEGLKNVTSVVVTDDATPTPATFVAGTDYTLDAENGLITIVEGGGINDDTNLEVTFNNPAYSFTRITAGDVKKQGELRWVSANPDGPQRGYVIPWVKMGPAGDLNLVQQTDWGTIGLEGEVLEKDGHAPWTAFGAPVTA